MTPSEIGATLVALFAVFYFLGRLPTVTALAGFFGVVLIGTQGWLGRTLSDVATWANQHIVSRLIVDVLGSGTAFLLTLILGIIFIHDLLPKNTSGRRTAWIGIALATVIVAGVTGIPALAGLRQSIVNSFSTL